MTQQKALFLEKPLGAFVVEDRPIPSPGPGDLLIKVEVTALNPLEWKLHRGLVSAYVDKYPVILGVDIAGTVVDVGEGVTHFAKGDRVAGYQQYTLTVAELTAKVPSQLPLEEAASIPSASVADAFGLYAEDNPDGPGGAGLTPPWETGGRGKYSAIQFARLSGFSPIIVTASSRNESIVKSLGATHVIDKNLSGDSLRTAVSSITSTPIEIIYDEVSLRDTQQAAYDLLALGGTLALTLPPTFQADAQARKRSGAEEVEPELLCCPEDLLAKGDIKPNPVRVLPDGLHGVAGGLNDLEEGRVSGQKLVASPQETKNQI
ncbi:GroES-like protein [Gloeophyllum trabeum ATCC 11539]|uniref:GroES-like protein n=1 Tax=Gloeophyllum trabeum (strain ATCC 11539 / FP-39264 / Madison 617) TaxID=670483 RepID=S7Q904_GLOTA|nr:GroES-like protein [Gloeophyllum trabeum ATCC 11539]EPQ55918.1 GroES-like protein [Gloeophyllum trabeum ATCC 11539]